MEKKINLLNKIEKFFNEIHTGWNFVKITVQRVIKEYCDFPEKEIKLFLGSKTEKLFTQHFRLSTTLLIYTLKSIGINEVDKVQLSDGHVSIFLK